MSEKVKVHYGGTLGDVTEVVYGRGITWKTRVQPVPAKMSKYLFECGNPNFSRCLDPTAAAEMYGLSVDDIDDYIADGIVAMTRDTKRALRKLRDKPKPATKKKRGEK